MTSYKTEIYIKYLEDCIRQYEEYLSLKNYEIQTNTIHPTEIIQVKYAHTSYVRLTKQLDYQYRKALTQSTPVPRNSRPPPFSLANSSASKREPVRLSLAEQKAGVGLELSVDGTETGSPGSKPNHNIITHGFNTNATPFNSPIKYRSQAIISQSKPFAPEPMTSYRQEEKREVGLEFSVNGTDKSQLLVHPEGVRLMDFRSSIGVYDKSTPHGTFTFPDTYLYNLFGPHRCNHGIACPGFWDAKLCSNHD
jgi:hypothetical protein